MQGLLLKDIYTLFKQMKIMLLILVVFACMPGYSLAPFAVLYAAMLPITAMAYDERSKWDELAVMMPYTTRSIVLSKYVLGFAAVLAAAVIAAAAQLVIGIVRGTGMDSAELLGLLLIACLSLILLCLNLPLMFRFGVEKGRIAFVLLVCGGVVGGMALREQLLASLDKMESPALLAFGALILTAVITVGSVLISAAVYRRKRG